jgi:hypothetical protein
VNVPLLVAGSLAILGAFGIQFDPDSNDNPIEETRRAGMATWEFRHVRVDRNADRENVAHENGGDGIHTEEPRPRSQKH